LSQAEGYFDESTSFEDTISINILGDVQNKSISILDSQLFG
jgi:hypothetical protein